MYRLTVTLRGLWWRRGLTAALLLVATITTAAAALGPLYARAAAESTLYDQLHNAPVTSTGLHYSSVVDAVDQLAISSVEDLGPKPGRIVGYPKRIVGEYARTNATGPVKTAALWRQGICAHLVIISGHCPTRAGQALASQRTVAGHYGWARGGKVDLADLHVSGTDASGFPVFKPASVTITGVYRPVDTADPYWFGQGYFEVSSGSDGVDTVDPLVVAQAQFRSFASPQNARIDIDLPLDAAAVHWADVPALRRGVDRVQAVTQAQAAGASTVDTGASPLRTGVQQVLAAAGRQRDLVGTGTTLVTAQLGLLAWLVLFQVVSDAAEARGNEIALAKVRGRPTFATLRFGLSEPLLLMIIAIPLGLLLALAVAHVFSAAVLADSTPVVMPRSALLAALIAFAGGLAAAAFAAQRTLSRSVLDQWQRTSRRPKRGVLGLLIDLVAAAAAVTALIVLRRGGGLGTDNASASLLAPGLVVAAVALVGVRLLPLVCRSLTGPTRARRNVALFLAIRQVGRRPAGLRLAALLAVALGLATFAVAGEAVARANRTARAQAELGAQRVASIQYSRTHDPRAAVQHADPGGRWAMAAVTWLPDGGGSVTGTVLGVDPGRLPAVAAPVAGGPDNAEIARVIGRSPLPAVSVHSDVIRLDITASDLSADPQPVVQANLRRPTAAVAAQGGALKAGRHTYLVKVPCSNGCTFSGLTWYRPYGAVDEQHGTVIVHQASQQTKQGWKTLPLRLNQPQAWRRGAVLGQARDAPTATAAGLRDEFSSEDGGYGGVDYADTPVPVPVLATRGGLVPEATTSKVLQMTDNTSTVLTFQVQRFVPVLPVVLRNGLVLDINFLVDQVPGFAGEANWQVWLGRHAPADAVQRLRAAGLVVQNVKTVDQRVTVLARQGPALALLLLLGCAIAGTVFAVGGTAISVSASSRRRSYELAALRAVKVPRRTLFRAGIIEQLLLLGTAVVLGVPSGLFAAVLTLPTIPEFADAAPIRLHYGAPALPIILFVLAFVLLLVGTAVVASRNLIRVAVPTRLREEAL